MSEYTEVEQPFLQQLATLGWQTIDQGQGIPSNPAASLRTTFRQWLLPNVFNQAVAALNTASIEGDTIPGSPPNSSKTCKTKSVASPTARC